MQRIVRFLESCSPEDLNEFVLSNFDTIKSIQASLLPRTARTLRTAIERRGRAADSRPKYDSSPRCSCGQPLTLLDGRRLGFCAVCRVFHNRCDHPDHAAGGSNSESCARGGEGSAAQRIRARSIYSSANHLHEFLSRLNGQAVPLIPTRQFEIIDSCLRERAVDPRTDTRATSVSFWRNLFKHAQYTHADSRLHTYYHHIVFLRHMYAGGPRLAQLSARDMARLQRAYVLVLRESSAAFKLFNGASTRKNSWGFAVLVGLLLTLFGNKRHRRFLRDHAGVLRPYGYTVPASDCTAGAALMRVLMAHQAELKKIFFYWRIRSFVMGEHLIRRAGARAPCATPFQIRCGRAYVTRAVPAPCSVPLWLYPSHRRI